MTLESGGVVTLRAVAPAAGGVGIGAYTWNASQRWFDPAAHAAHFLVLTAPGLPDAAGGSGLTVAAGGRHVRPSGPALTDTTHTPS